MCYSYNKFGQLVKKCRNMPRLISQVNLIEEQLVAMIIKINFVFRSKGQWADNGVTRHVCYDRDFFKSYSEVEDKKVLLDDSHSTIVVGIGEVELKFTFEKRLSRTMLCILQR